MKTIMIMMPFIFGGALAYGSTLNCSGNYEGYDFTITAPTSGQTVSGNINCDVSQDGHSLTTIVLTPTSSQIIVGHSIAFSGASSDANGTLNATYSGGSYTGTVAVTSSMGNATVPVTCNLN